MIYKASGQTTNTTGTTETAPAGNNNANVNAQVAGGVASTAVTAAGEIGAAALSKINPLGWVDSLIGGVTSIVSTVTGGIVNLGTTRNNNSAANMQTYWITAKDRQEERDNNMSFYIIVGLMVVAAMVVLILENKKSK